MKRLILLAVFICISAAAYSQQLHEYYFKFKVTDKSFINNLSKVISIDNVQGDEVYAYANDKEFVEFMKYGIKFEFLPKPGDLADVKMSGNVDEIKEWDVYPTYDGYVTMMNQFAAQYPSLCKIVNAGSTVQGRAILFAVISDNVQTKEPEPQFMYTSSMHGDETTGYVLMLRLINYLLTNYTVIPKVTNLVNNIEIWINPLANPDGTYHGGNGTVNGAWRYNANSVDLNRNFPPTDNWNSGTPQQERIVMCNLAEANRFVMSCNFHGGSEVVNYPWDSWSRLTADNNWWYYVCRQYADTVHANAPSTYMDGFDNGITNGYAWYYVGGGRQDYMTYFRRGRECTIEISNTKLLPPAQLPAHWDYNYKSFLNYMQKCLYGITGTVKDSSTLQPLNRAKVTIASLDVDSSEVLSDSLFGKYYRMIYTGTYSLTFSKTGYYSKTVTNVKAKNDSTTILNVLLRPIPVSVTNNGNTIPKEFGLSQNYPNPFNPSTTITFTLPKESDITLKIYDIAGREAAELINGVLKAGEYNYKFDASNLSSGIYFYSVKAGNFTDTKRMVLLK